MVSYQQGNFEIPSFSGKYAANDTWAYITRQQWDDYLTRFAPLEEKMIGMTTYANPSVVGEEVSKGQQAAIQGVDNYRDMSRQYMSRYGAAIDPRAQMQQDRMQNLTKSSAIVDAASRIRQTLMDQDRQIAFGAATSGLNPDTMSANR